MSTLDTLARQWEADTASALEKVNRYHAQRFLKEFRAMLSRFNLTRHNVTISSGMGSACLCINGEVWSHQWEGRTAGNVAPVLCELRVISANLSHEWADYLHGESLTHYTGKHSQLR